jgi:hypothetical protein
MTAGPPAAGSSGFVPPRLFVALALASVAAFAGCSRDEQVEVLRVPKDAPSEPAADQGIAEPAARTDRMFAAIVPHGDTAWFFKLVGPEAAVAPHKGEFLALVKSVAFDGDTPKWTAPAGWSEQPASGMRFATLVVPGEPPLEVSVSSLGMPAEGREEYILANVNRWRGQMGLPPITVDRLHVGGDADDETIDLPLADGTKATLVSLKGTSSGGMTPPFAGGGRPPMMSRDLPPAREDSPPAGESPLKYELPEGWKELGPEGISVAAFETEAGKVTVTRLAGGNELLANVNRWRDQVGLPHIDESQLGETVESVTLGDGGKADYVVLTGPEGASPRKAILGVMAKRGDTAWFVKLVGDADAVSREKPRFESFVKSLRFLDDDGKN